MMQGATYQNDCWVKPEEDAEGEDRPLDDSPGKEAEELQLECVVKTIILGMCISRWVRTYVYKYVGKNVCRYVCVYAGMYV